MRVDNYKEGFFSAYWHSSSSLSGFLEGVEEFLSQVDIVTEKTPTSESPDDRYFTQLFIKGEGELKEWNYLRPLTEQDLKESGVITDDILPRVGLIRVNSPWADFCYEPINKRIGVIAETEIDTLTKVMQATATFVQRTQPVLSQDIVLNVLGRLPYNPQKTDAS